MAVAALSTKNPYYLSREVDWMMMRDAFGGERYIKDKGQEYLPATTAMQANGMAYGQPGFQAYEAYKARAVYHELVRPALEAVLGVMHRKPPVVELPAKLEKMRKAATFEGGSIHWLVQKVNEQQLLMGRYGLLADVADGAAPTALPYIIGYNAETIVNWDASKVGDDQGLRTLNLVVLNESDYERRAGLAWIQMMRYRILAMAGDVRDIWDVQGASDDQYIAAEVRHTQDAASADFTQPQLAGRGLEAVPFVFVGPRDMMPEPDMPVMMPLARLALAIYRTEADYRQALFMQGQDVLVVVGQQADMNAGKTQVGAFGSIDLPIGGSAEYIGATSQGVPCLEKAIQNDFARAAQLGSQLLTERGNEAEAAQALNIRVGSRTATLTTVAQTGAAGVEKILKHCAVWVGADPDQVSVTPNLDFADDVVQAQDSVYLMTAKKMGMPLSERSIHGWLKRNDFTNLDYEEEKELLASEEPLVTGTPGLAGVAGTPPGLQDSPGGGMPSEGNPNQSRRGGNRASRQRTREKDGTVGGSPAGSPGLGGSTPLNQ